MRKRKHRPSTRLTNAERTRAVCDELTGFGVFRSTDCAKTHPVILRALQAAVRQALARKKARTVVVRQLVQNAGPYVTKCPVERCTRGPGHMGAHSI